MTKEAYYFSHDSNARNDIKIVRLRRSLGLEGYGIYFCLIEILREQAEHKLPIANIPDIAFDINTSEEKVKAVVLSFDLFAIDNDLFFSERLLRSMLEYNERKVKLSNAGKKGNAMRWPSDRVAIGSGSGSDGHPIALKKRKENERKVNKIFIPPTLLEVEFYFVEKGYSKTVAKKAFEYYTAGEWCDAKGQKVKNWKQKMQGVWFKEENRSQTGGALSYDQLKNKGWKNCNAEELKFAYDHQHRTAFSYADYDPTELLAKAGEPITRAEVDARK